MVTGAPAADALHQRHSVHVIMGEEGRPATGARRGTRLSRCRGRTCMAHDVVGRLNSLGRSECHPVPCRAEVRVLSSWLVGRGAGTGSAVGRGYGTTSARVSRLPGYRGTRRPLTAVLAAGMVAFDVNDPVHGAVVLLELHAARRASTAASMSST
jgi:hypothetical protein